VDVVSQLRHQRRGKQVEGDEDQEDDGDGSKNGLGDWGHVRFRVPRFQGSGVPGFRSRVQGLRRHEQDENREAQLNRA
jgi:hypothetical protein